MVILLAMIVLDIIGIPFILLEKFAKIKDI
jgi:hypothetical protein